jgi:hypothetical protein
MVRKMCTSGSPDGSAATATVRPASPLPLPSPSCAPPGAPEPTTMRLSRWVGAGAVLLGHDDNPRHAE